LKAIGGNKPAQDSWFHNIFCSNPHR